MDDQKDFQSRFLRKGAKGRTNFFLFLNIKGRTTVPRESVVGVLPKPDTHVPKEGGDVITYILVLPATTFLKI